MQHQPTAEPFDIGEARRVLGDVFAPWVQDLGLSIASIECAAPPGAPADWQPGAILRMAYRPTVRVAKTRRVASLPDCSLCVDDLEGVGAFLELERLVPDETDAGVVQAELAEFVASLDIVVTRTAETYDSLVRAAQQASS